ncbi:MAG: hypothetical protein EPO40_21095 [Myxococcaceae bacterium]|nr:MAG: hypothetical protein EPO40_21095 [Myxococcaceae bacterium]
MAVFPEPEAPHADEDPVDAVEPAHGRRVGRAGRILGASASVCFLWPWIVPIHHLLAWVEST